MIPPSSSRSSEYLGFMSFAAWKSPGMSLSSAGVDAPAVKEQLAHVADVEQAGVFASPQMLGHDAFVLDRHLIAGEGDHPAAPWRDARRPAQACRELRLRTVATFGVAAERLPAPGFVSRTCGLLGSSRAPDGCDSRARPGFDCRPRLSLAPESFAPSAARYRDGGHFPDCQARAVPGA